MLTKNNNGSALLFVMLALIGAGFMAKLVLGVDHNSKITHMQYSNSESARMAVQSGFNDAIAYFARVTKAEFDAETDHAKDVINRLEVLANSDDILNLPSSILYLSGSSTTYKRVTNDVQYRVSIVAFDNTEFNITFHSEGIGRGGAKASAIGTYNLSGLNYRETDEWGEQNALHLEDDVQIRFRAPIHIYGPARLSKNVTFDAHADNSVFHDNVFFQNSDIDITLRGQYTFHRNVYWGSKPKFEWWHKGGTNFSPSLINIHMRSGFPKGLELMQAHFGTDKRVEANLHGESYWLKSPTTAVERVPNSFINFNNNLIEMTHHDLTRITAQNATNTRTNTSLDQNAILTSLGMTDKQCKVKIDVSAIPDTCIHKKEGITAANLNSWYEDASIKKFKDKFLVIKVDTREDLSDAGEDVFAKTIILVSNGGKLQPTHQGKIFSTKLEKSGNNRVNRETSGHVSIIALPGSEVQNFGGWNNGFRGLFYASTNSKFIVGGSEHAYPSTKHFHGALYAQTGAEMEWYPQAGYHGHIHFDPTVYQDLAELDGFLTLDCGDESDEYKRLLVVDNTIGVNLKSRSF